MSKIEDEVCEEIQARAKVGETKYGTTMERTDFDTVTWLQYALEEALDLAVYLKRLQHDYIKLQRRTNWLELVVAKCLDNGLDIEAEGLPKWKPEE